MILKQNKPGSKGFIFDIQGLSVHDGPGCRTLIFLNGCTLNCFWCCNPEGLSKFPSMMYYSSRCISCHKCIENCPHHSISIFNNKLKIDRKHCDACIKKSCMNECYTDALKLGGYEITVSKLLEIIKRDRQFWGANGGITLTGGEPLLQIDFTKEILTECHKAYIHTAIETCGNIPQENIKKVIPFIDWIFFDIKHFNNMEHKKATKLNNSQILENAIMLSKEFPGRLIFRLPLIPNYNDSKENIDSYISFLKNSGRNEINILPLHHLGKEKYIMLGKKYAGSDFSIPTIQHLNNIQNIFRNSGIACYVGSDTPF